MCTVQVRMSGVRQPGCVTPRLLSPGSKCRSYQNIQDCGLCVTMQLQSKAWDIWILLVYSVSVWQSWREDHRQMLILSVYLGALHRDARWGYSKKPNCLSDLFGTAQVNKKKELWEDVSNLAVVFWREIWEGREKWVQVKGILLWPGFLITVVTSKVKEVPTNSSGGGEMDKMKE